MRSKLVWFRALPFGLALGLLSLSAVRRIFRLPAPLSFAQGAEDLIAQYYLAGVTTGVYVDVGCNEPIRYSNTFWFYLRGWRGINIDADQEFIDKCKHVRKQDISICAAVSNVEGEATFYKAAGGLQSTLDASKVEAWKELFTEKRKEQVRTQTLTNILAEHLPDERVDLLTIDAEGHDLQVLEGLDLTRWRPKLIIVEVLDLDSVQGSDVFEYLTANGYSLKAFAIMSAFFADTQRS